MTSSARDLLRGLPVFPDRMRAFDPSTAPDSPVDLFLEWLEQAIDDGVSAPHAVNVATVGQDGSPDARVVILKDIDERGFSFATSSESPKGLQLQAAPTAALTFFWQSAGRQIRIRGAATPGSTEENDADFRRRHPVARALVLAGRQSDVVREPVDTAVERELEGIEGKGSATWTVYTVAPERVEFWQADQERRHLRLRYISSGEGWRKEVLWP
ncbi:pyridoxal 5'-phosphate synthase [Arthrobacter sp. H5]|uniref:pyridoxine/pyridoxamine 5'-phosphate oxidase n=1 Tax=Arthrobacter sp. H5 TaxID=1267973 RepID=UPI00048503B2|nr:pyridoxal 5'-phosphate synthase [Arthrobacter sp. H5]